MPFKPLTHESFHTGLSANGNDQKWADMHNFRSAKGRTRAVPRKFRLIEEAGLHTIAATGGRLNYAIGTTVSYAFIGGDDGVEETYPLYRAAVFHETPDNKSPKGLPVRGTYTGGEETIITVAFSKPADPEPEVVTPVDEPINCYGCCTSNEIVTITGTVKIEGGDVVPGGIVQIFGGGAIIGGGVPNGFGIFQVGIPIGNWLLVIKIPGYHDFVQPLNVTASGSLEFVVTPITETPHILQPGTRVLLFFNPGYVPEPAPPFDFAINGVTTINGVWTPPGSSPGIMEYTLTTVDLLYIWALQTGGIDEYVFDIPMIETGVYAGIQVFSHTGELLLNEPINGSTATRTLP